MGIDYILGKTDLNDIGTMGDWQMCATPSTMYTLKHIFTFVGFTISIKSYMEREWFPFMLMTSILSESFLYTT